jgi:hypothetical protein
MIFCDDYFRCVPNKEKGLLTPAFLWGIDVMIKSRAGLALRLILAGSRSAWISDKYCKWHPGKCRVHRRAYKWIRGEMKASPLIGKAEKKRAEKWKRYR